jgi:hypothetical protein
MQLLAPTFKTVGRNNRLVVDNEGRSLITFLPRVQDGASTGFSFQDRLSIALSPKEMGLILSQLPDRGVEVNRQQRPLDGMDTQGGAGPSKVLTVTPSIDSSVLFKLASVDDYGNSRSMEVDVQAGEYEVIKSIWRASLPSLTGFDSLLKMQTDAELNKAKR